MLPPHIVGHIGSDSLRVGSIVSTAVFSHSLLKREEHWIPSKEAKGKIKSSFTSRCGPAF